MDVALLTHVPPGYDDSVLADLQLISAGTVPAPRFINQYDEDGHRTQLLLAEGNPLSLFDITSAVEVSQPDALFVAPAVHEVADVPLTPLPVFLTLQGYFRITDANHRVYPDPNAWARIERVVRPGNHTFWSVEDAGERNHARQIAENLTHAGVFTAVTADEQGAWFPRHNSRDGECPLKWRDAIPAKNLIDPTGAGDAFATAYCVRFLETGDENEAERFALAAGSLAVERTGILAVPGRAAIETRAKQAGER